MAYSEVDDLLLGDLTIGGTLSKDAFVTDAADEVDSKVGARYVTPVDTALLADHSRKLLKRIANNLATGRLIMAVTSAGEDQQLQQYGFYLVKQAESELTAIANGQIELVGAVLQDAFAVSGNGPSIINADADSAVDAFYRNVMNQEEIGWVPG